MNKIKYAIFNEFNSLPSIKIKKSLEESYYSNFLSLIDQINDKMSKIESVSFSLTEKEHILEQLNQLFKLFQDLNFCNKLSFQKIISEIENYEKNEEVIFSISKEIYLSFIPLLKDMEYACPSILSSNSFIDLYFEIRKQLLNITQYFISFYISKEHEYYKPLKIDDNLFTNHCCKKLSFLREKLNKINHSFNQFELVKELNYLSFINSSSKESFYKEERRLSIIENIFTFIGLLSVFLIAYCFDNIFISFPIAFFIFVTCSSIFIPIVNKLPKDFLFTLTKEEKIHFLTLLKEKEISSQYIKDITEEDFFTKKELMLKVMNNAVLKK